MCSIESKVNADVKILNDKHYYLIEMWKALQNGWQPPEVTTNEQYKYIKEHKDENAALSGYIGFCHSFGGKWFAGLARKTKGDAYCKVGTKSVYQVVDGIKDAKFSCLDYRDVVIPEGAVVYCDPPYDKTTGYNSEIFNQEEFWQYMRQLSETNIVLISEQHCTDDFVSIWNKPLKRMICNVRDNVFEATEHLFVHKKYQDLFLDLTNQ